MGRPGETCYACIFLFPLDWAKKLFHFFCIDLFIAERSLIMTSHHAPVMIPKQLVESYCSMFSEVWNMKHETFILSNKLYNVVNIYTKSL